MNTNISQEFIDIVKKYIAIDDEILKMKQEIKKNNEIKKGHENYIINYLNNIGENIIEINGSMLKKNVNKTYGGINKKIIQESLDHLLKPSDDTSKIINHILSNRKLKENIILKRIMTNN
jgi:coenzyme F420-reducing hydrogenase alpha subunit